MKCNLKEFGCYKAIISAALILIGLAIQFPSTLESMPPKYSLFGIIMTESQYAVVDYISLLLILLPIVYLSYLVGKKKKN